MLKIIDIINEEDNNIDDYIRDFMPPASLRSTPVHNERNDQSMLESGSSSIDGDVTVHSASLSLSNDSSRKRSNDNDCDQTSSYRAKKATKQRRCQLSDGVEQHQQELSLLKTISPASDTIQQRHLEKNHSDHEASRVEECDEGNNNTDLASSTTIQQSIKTPTKSFDERVKDLVAFKTKYGHCNVPRSDKLPEYKSLGTWCHFIRQCHKGKKRRITPSEVKDLEALGFQWNPIEIKAAKTFDRWYKDLVAFKEKFGHCNVPTSYSSRYPEYKSLGVWCKGIRQIYRGTAKHRAALSPSNIRDLERIGFKFYFPNAKDSNR